MDKNRQQNQRGAILLAHRQQAFMQQSVQLSKMGCTVCLLSEIANRGSLPVRVCDIFVAFPINFCGSTDLRLI